MLSVDDIRAHVLDLKRRHVTMIGHRAMLARCLDEIDALLAALMEARGKRDAMQVRAEAAESDWQSAERVLDAIRAAFASSMTDGHVLRAIRAALPPQEREGSRGARRDRAQ